MKKRYVWGIIFAALLIVAASLSSLAGADTASARLWQCTVDGKPDQDCDGIPDENDACITDPGPKEFSGCSNHPICQSPIDTDNDGANDNCPPPVDPCPNQWGPPELNYCISGPSGTIYSCSSEVRIRANPNQGAEIIGLLPLLPASGYYGIPFASILPDYSWYFVNYGGRWAWVSASVVSIAPPVCLEPTPEPTPTRDSELQGRINELEETCNDVYKRVNILQDTAIIESYLNFRDPCDAFDDYFEDIDRTPDPLINDLIQAVITNCPEHQIWITAELGRLTSVGDSIPYKANTICTELDQGVSGKRSFITTCLPFIKNNQSKVLEGRITTLGIDLAALPIDEVCHVIRLVDQMGPLSSDQNRFYWTLRGDCQSQLTVKDTLKLTRTFLIFGMNMTLFGQLWTNPDQQCNWTAIENLLLSIPVDPDDLMKGVDSALYTCPVEIIQLFKNHENNLNADQKERLLCQSPGRDVCAVVEDYITDRVVPADRCNLVTDTPSGEQPTQTPTPNLSVISTKVAELQFGLKLDLSPILDIDSTSAVAVFVANQATELYSYHFYNLEAASAAAFGCDMQNDEPNFRECARLITTVTPGSQILFPTLSRTGKLVVYYEQKNDTTASLRLMCLDLRISNPQPQVIYDGADQFDLVLARPGWTNGQDDYSDGEGSETLFISLHHKSSNEVDIYTRKIMSCSTKLVDDSTGDSPISFKKEVITNAGNIAISPDQQILVYDTPDGEIQWISISSGRNIETLPKPEPGANSQEIKCKLPVYNLDRTLLFLCSQRDEIFQLFHYISTTTDSEDNGLNRPVPLIFTGQSPDLLAIAALPLQSYFNYTIADNSVNASYLNHPQVAPYPDQRLDSHPVSEIFWVIRDFDDETIAATPTP